MGHDLKDSFFVDEELKGRMDDELPFSVALKVESNLLGKECFLLGSNSRKF